MDTTIWGQWVRRYFRAAALLLDPGNIRAGSFQRDQAAEDGFVRVDHRS
jgi:hypothetical protein